ncbi:Hypothetical predicted protein [Podarcis lilfordi]|uniref:Uncharacterized protein n=1 Tax=Podarcis lilfordi TaxID=74358 RepID=A0AA35PR90_9SAUR|nr:Hypothetical predicted protein [Podarcis lilfordi]
MLGIAVPSPPPLSSRLPAGSLCPFTAPPFLHLERGGIRREWAGAAAGEEEASRAGLCTLGLREASASAEHAFQSKKWITQQGRATLPKLCARPRKAKVTLKNSQFCHKK